MLVPPNRKSADTGKQQIIPVWIGIEGHRQIHHDPHADSAMWNPYPPFQAFVHGDIDVCMSPDIEDGPRSVKKLADIITAAIHKS